MGIMAGAEMTTLEMRFVALRCRDTMAPTGTLALGAGAGQVNALGLPYEEAYGRTTSQRVWAARSEMRAGRGPCGLSARLDPEARDELLRAYLNMCPSQTLKFLEEAPELRPEGPDGAVELKVEIGASEPYVQGGHTAGGFWVDTDRRTTVRGLWAAGDAAGGAPQKFVTGSMAEAEIVALDISRRLASGEIRQDPSPSPDRPAARLAREAACGLRSRLSGERPLLDARDLEEALQKTMDVYAGGIGADYRCSLAELEEADSRISGLIGLGRRMTAPDQRALTRLWEARGRLIVARSLVAHLKAREETRWPGFGERSDHPLPDDRFLCHINSRLSGGRIEIIRRPLVREERYEHQS
jgi:adenylylsulfate reductase subunit A